MAEGILIETSDALGEWVGKTISIDIKPADVKRAASEAGESIERTQAKIQARILKRRNGYVIQFIDGAKAVVLEALSQALEG